MCVPNTLNQYSKVGGVNYNYDNNGNLTSDGTNTYTYDAQNRLTTVTTPTTFSTYSYDAFNRRVSKTVSGVTTYYLYDGAEVIEEKGNQDAQYLYGGGLDEMLQMSRAGQDYFYFADGLGSVTDLTSPAGSIVEHYAYDPYGAVRPRSSVGNPYFFTGREFDPESGLYNYRLRNYHPQIGRFLQRDPLGYWDGMNLFEYVGNSPLNWIDPFGLVKASGWIKDCLDMIFGENVGDVNVRQADVWVGLHGKYVDATTRRNLIIVKGPVEDFWKKEKTVLHEYYHVLRQWNKGSLTRTKYLWTLLKEGYEDNPYEQEAKKFAKDNLQAFQDCLKEEPCTEEPEP